MFLGAVDIANNRRENLTLHDVMKSNRQTLGCLALFLAVAEVNVISAHKQYTHDGASVHHGYLRWRLAQYPVSYAQNLHGAAEPITYAASQRSQALHMVHKRVFLSKNATGIAENVPAVRADARRNHA